jgi:hypothetical protein
LRVEGIWAFYLPFFHFFTDVLLEQAPILLALLFRVWQLRLFVGFITDSVEVERIRCIEFDTSRTLGLAFGLCNKLEALDSFMLVNFGFKLVLDIKTISSFLFHQ